MNKITILSLHLGYGGIETAVCTLANKLIENNDVTILSVYKLPGTIPHKLNSKIKIRYIVEQAPNKENIKKCLKSFDIIKLLKEGFYAIKLLIKRKRNAKINLKNCQADFIISTRYLLNGWLKYIKKRNILKIGWEHNHHNNNNKYIKKVVRSCKQLDYLINVSKELTEFYAKKLKKMECKSKYIPNMIDIDDVHSKLDNNSIISIGRLSKEKGFPDLIDVFNEVLKTNPKCKLNIVGDGNQRDLLVQKIKEYGIEKNVELHGFQNKDYINKLLLSQSLYIMTSYTESFGIVLIEAMNKGIPCIAFDSAQGANEIIVNSINGYIIKDRNKVEMSNKINYLLKNKKELIKLNDGTIKTCSKYTSSIIIKEWEKLFVKKSLNNLKVLFISSTGGHLSELLQMEKIFDDFNYHLITEKTKSTIDLKNKYKNRISYLVYGTKAKMLSYIYKFPYNCIKSLFLYIKIKPKVIITTGAHTAVPMCYIGKLFGNKIIFIETLANIDTQTLSGKLVYPIADLFIVQWENMLKLYPKAILGGKMY